MGYCPWDLKDSDTTKRLHFLSFFFIPYLIFFFSPFLHIQKYLLTIYYMEIISLFHFFYFQSLLICLFKMQFNVAGIEHIAFLNLNVYLSLGLLSPYLFNIYFFTINSYWFPFILSFCCSSANFGINCFIFYIWYIALSFYYYFNDCFRVYNLKCTRYQCLPTVKIVPLWSLFTTFHIALHVSHQARHTWHFTNIIIL